MKDWLRREKVGDGTTFSVNPILIPTSKAPYTPSSSVNFFLLVSFESLGVFYMSYSTLLTTTQTCVNKQDP